MNPMRRNIKQSALVLAALTVGANFILGCSQQKAELGSTRIQNQQDELKHLNDLHVPDAVKQRIIAENSHKSN